jgi:hypothetical protein
MSVIDKFGKWETSESLDPSTKAPFDYAQGEPERETTRVVLTTSNLPIHYRLGIAWPYKLSSFSPEFLTR